MPKSRVESFSPELLEVFREASSRDVEIGPFTEQQAIRLRARLNSLRAAMRKERHALLPVAERVTVRLTQTTDADTLEEGKPAGWWVVCTPEGDADFIDAIKRAGISITDAPPPSLPDIASDLPAPSTGSNVESILEQFRQKKEDKK